MEEESLIAVINQEVDLDLPEHTAFADMRLRLQQAIGKMINDDFQKLVHLLYRVDVNERKLKYLLQENVGEEAAVIIADLIIERQLEKIESRKAFRENNEASSFDEEERW